MHDVAGLVALFLGAPVVGWLVVGLGRRLRSAREQQTRPAPMGASTLPVSMTSYVRRHASCIGIAVERVARREIPFGLCAIETMDARGVGRVHLVIVDEARFQHVLRPLLEKEASCGR